MFSQAVIEQLGYYVYFLQDPRDNKIFYIGKGVDNRIFNHLKCAITNSDNTEKLDTIRDIIDSGNKVKHFILRHGLSEKVAFEVEASLIDFVGMQNLSNLQSGHYSNDYGLKTPNEIITMYEASSLETSESVLLININKLYHRDITDIELYNATRKSWVLSERRNKAKYAIATYRGLTREVYKINDWFPVIVNNKTRWGFDGEKANNNIREKLIYKSITKFFPKGAANPIKYINC